METPTTHTRRAVLALALVTAVPAAAHHGWAGYLQEDFELAGTVQSAYLGNPHGVVKVQDTVGKVWDVVLGIALLFGAVTLLDLRLMGAWRSVPRSALARPAVPVAAAGFLLAVSSGVGLLSVKAVEYAGNPFLYAKLGAIALAGGNALLLHRSAAWRGGGDGRGLVWAGAASLACWLGAVTAGRMIAYY